MGGEVFSGWRCLDVNCELGSDLFCVALIGDCCLRVGEWFCMLMEVTREGGC